VLVDANLLVYATDAQSPHHDIANAWLDGVLNGTERVGLAWEVLGAFMRLMTNPRAALSPMPPPAAWDVVESWLSSEVTWIPAPSRRSVAILGELVVRHHVAAKLIPDAQLAALAIEHGQTVVSADSDFARFPEVRWVNPLRGGRG